MKKFAPLIVLSLFLTYPTYATDGYFPHGYGVKSQGMGGIGVAFPQDSIAAAMNPAGMGRKWAMLEAYDLVFVCCPSCRQCRSQ